MTEPQKYIGTAEEEKAHIHRYNPETMSVVGEHDGAQIIVERNRQLAEINFCLADWLGRKKRKFKIRAEISIIRSDSDRVHVVPAMADVLEEHFPKVTTFSVHSYVPGKGYGQFLRERAEEVTLNDWIFVCDISEGEKTSSYLRKAHPEAIYLGRNPNRDRTFIYSNDPEKRAEMTALKSKIRVLRHLRSVE